MTGGATIQGAGVLGCSTPVETLRMMLLCSVVLGPAVFPHNPTASTASKLHVSTQARENLAEWTDRCPSMDRSTRLCGVGLITHRVLSTMLLSVLL